MEVFLLCLCPAFPVLIAMACLFVHPQIHMLKPNSTVMVLGGSTLGNEEAIRVDPPAPHDGISASLVKEIPESSLMTPPPPTMWGHNEKSVT